jgi:FkbM family methyltransferase
MKSLLRRLVDRSGYFVKKHDNLTGVDWARDVARVLPGSVECAFDVGANVGQTVRYFVKRFPKATIHAFEPVPSTYADLVRAVGSLPKVTCHNLALSDSATKREIVTTAISGHSSFTSPLSANDPNAKKQVVETITADAFASAHGIERIDVLKIDTEGHEMAVLDGAAGLLAKGAVRSVYAEVTPSAANRHNTQFAQVFDRLTAAGFRFMGLYEIEWLQKLPPETAFCNALFVRPT